MNLPIHLNGITHLGVWYWVEIEGYDKVVRRQSGNFCFLENEIMGWECANLGEIFERQKKEKAPRVRYWACEEQPTMLERLTAGWWDDCRLWLPLFSDIYDLQNHCYRDERIEQFYADGTCSWEDVT